MEWRPYPNVSALQMASVSVAGALLAAGSMVVPHLFRHAQPTSGRVMSAVALSLAPFVIGATVWLLAILQLTTGIKRSFWPESQIESLRTVTESPLLAVTGLVFFGIFLLSAFPFTPHPAHPALRGIGWASFVLGQCCSQLGFSTRRTRTPPTNRLDWRTRPPLHSDHWGGH